MQDLLKKIIEMDEKAREIEQNAKSEKEKSEREVEQLREQIYNDFIERAKDRVEKNIAVEQSRADAKIRDYTERTDSVKAEMQRLSEQNMDNWVDEIVNRALA